MGGVVGVGVLNVRGNAEERNGGIWERAEHPTGPGVSRRVVSFTRLRSGNL